MNDPNEKIELRGNTYTRAQLDEAWDLVCPTKHGGKDWKDRINARVRYDAPGFALVGLAIEFFTATKMRVTDGDAESCQIVADGYRAGPAN